MREWRIHYIDQTVRPNRKRTQAVQAWNIYPALEEFAQLHKGENVYIVAVKSH